MTTSNSSASATGTSKSSSNENQYLVAIVDSSVTSNSDSHTGTNLNHKEVYQPIRLACPSTGDEKDYLQVTTAGNSNNSSNSHLLEIQCLNDHSPTNKHYQSWFVGNTVVSNGKLYVMTRVDPLFWVLPKAQQQQQSQPQQKWQPLEQMLEGQPESILKLLMQTKTKGQLLHLCDTYEMDEDELFYKFSPSKALCWLQKKQQAVYTVLLNQLVAAQARQQVLQQTGGGAFAADFSLSSEAVSASTDKSDANDGGPTKQQQTQAQRESLQIVCNYLSTEWQRLLLDHVKEEPKVLQHDDKQVKRVKQDHASTVVASSIIATEPVTKKPEAPKLSFGQKQLLKVNKKGMKSMTSFFAPKKKTAVAK